MRAGVPSRILAKRPADRDGRTGQTRDNTRGTMTRGNSLRDAGQCNCPPHCKGSALVRQPDAITPEQATTSTRNDLTRRQGAKTLAAAKIESRTRQAEPRAAVSHKCGIFSVASRSGIGREGRVMKTTETESWVVYLITVHGKPSGMNAVWRRANGTRCSSLSPTTTRSSAPALPVNPRRKSWRGVRRATSSPGCRGACERKPAPHLGEPLLAIFPVAARPVFFPRFRQPPSGAAPARIRVIGRNPPHTARLAFWIVCVRPPLPCNAFQRGKRPGDNARHRRWDADQGFRP